MTNDSLPICPICGEGKLHTLKLTNDVMYKDQHGTIPLLMSECDVCGSEQAGVTEARANKRAMLAFRKQVDGLLSGEEIRALRDRLEINQSQAANIFGGGPVAFSKYENDDVAQSESMDKLLRVAASIPDAFCWLATTAGETQIAMKAQTNQFMQWQSTVKNLMRKTYQHEPVTPKNNQSITFKMASSANDHMFRGELELVG